MKRIITIFATIVVTTGCASNPEFRGLARQTGVVVQNLRQGTAQFVEDQTALNADNAERLDLQATEAASYAAEARRQELAWTSDGRGDLLATYRLATVPTATQLAAAVDVRATRHAPVAGGGADENYEKAQGSLAKLARKPSTMSVLSGLVEFAGAVSTGLRELQDEAAETANATAEAGDTADNATDAIVQPET